MLHRLADRVALVTGSSSGIGRAIALAFAAHDARLIVCADLTPAARPEVPAEAKVPTHELICQTHGKGSAIFVKTDVRIASHMEACVGEAVARAGRLDVMVNNAGVGIEGVPIHELSEDRWESVMKLNLYGPFLGCKFACTQFLKQELAPDGHRGWIINVASAAGLVGIRNAAAYCASKAAVVNLTRAVALDYAVHKIHCNSLCPGFTKTAMTKSLFEHEQISAFMKASTPWWNAGSVVDVAKAAVFLASDDAAWVTGAALPVDGGFVAQ